jgi:flagellar hook-associated protein 2
MATITSPTYDPASTASALAQKYTAATQDSLTARTKLASATAKGLTDLGSAISTFQSSLESLTGVNKTLFAQSATFSDTTIGSATASASAVSGTYSFQVSQLATANQVSYSGLAADLGGALTVMVGTKPIGVTLAAGATPRDLAAAINASSDNTSLVTASVVTTGSTWELVLTAKNTGAPSAISLDTSGMAGSSLDDAANDPEPDPLLNRARTLVPAQDAIIHVGSASGTAITQPSNTFSVIDGVTMTFTRASATPVTLTVDADAGATKNNVQSLLDAYNKLKQTIDAMVDPGDPATGAAAGVFAHDGGIRALRDRLVSLMRPVGGTSLAAYGIIAEKDGTLSLNAITLNKKLAADPSGLDALVGSTAGLAGSGIVGSLDTFLKSWNNGPNAQLKKRKAANDDLQKTNTDRQARLDDQYNSAYQRYLMQFTQLQTLQSRMQATSSMFDALFSSDKSN